MRPVTEPVSVGQQISFSTSKSLPNRSIWLEHGGNREAVRLGR